MEFMLTFRGYIPTNGSNERINDVRELCHAQLKNLPALDPRFYPAAKGRRELLDLSTRPDGYEGQDYFRADRGGFEFVPLVQRHQDRVCELDIMWIRPVRTGIKSGRDLDNCYAVFTDALTLPGEDQLRGVTSPSDPATARRYCLLEDDSLVTGFSVRAFRSLEDLPPDPPDAKRSQKAIENVDLLIHIRLHQRQGYWGTSGVL